MLSFIKSLFSAPSLISIKWDDIKEFPNDRLISLLKCGDCEVHTGQMIVTELLSRLVDDSKSYGVKIYEPKITIDP